MWRATWRPWRATWRPQGETWRCAMLERARWNTAEYFCCVSHWCYFHQRKFLKLMTVLLNKSLNDGSPWIKSLCMIDRVWNHIVLYINIFFLLAHLQIVMQSFLHTYNRITTNLIIAMVAPAFLSDTFIASFSDSNDDALILISCSF